MIRASFQVSQASVETWALVNKPATTNPIRDWVQTGCSQKKLNVIPSCQTDCGDGNTGYCCYDTVFEKNEPCPCTQGFSAANPVNNLTHPWLNQYSRVGSTATGARALVVDPSYEWCPPEEPVGTPITMGCNCVEDFSCSREGVPVGQESPTYIPPRFMGKIGTGENADFGGAPKAKKMSLGCDAYKSVTEWDMKPIMADLAYIISLQAYASDVNSPFNTENDNYGVPYRNRRAEVLSAAEHLKTTFNNGNFDTLSDAIRSGFIDKTTGWPLKVNYETYYAQCAPTQCSYFETRHRSPVEIITTVFALVGGIDALAGVLYGTILFKIFAKVFNPDRKGGNKVEPKDTTPAKELEAVPAPAVVNPEPAPANIETVVGEAA